MWPYGPYSILEFSQDMVCGFMVELGPEGGCKLGRGPSRFFGITRTCTGAFFRKGGTTLSEAKRGGCRSSVFDTTLSCKCT